MCCRTCRDLNLRGPLLGAKASGTLLANPPLTEHRGIELKMGESMELLLITGPAGVGKSTLCWEMNARLAAAKVGHAVIETDELDRVFPRPAPEELARIQPGTTDVSSINLAAIWSTYRALGDTRLIVSGVMVHLDFDRRWILAAIPRCTNHGSPHAGYRADIAGHLRSANWLRRR